MKKIRTLFYGLIFFTVLNSAFAHPPSKKPDSLRTKSAVGISFLQYHKQCLHNSGFSFAYNFKAFRFFNVQLNLTPPIYYQYDHWECEDIFCRQGYKITIKHYFSEISLSLKLVPLQTSNMVLFFYLEPCYSFCKTTENDLASPIIGYFTKSIGVGTEFFINPATSIVLNVNLMTLGEYEEDYLTGGISLLFYFVHKRKN